MTPKPPKDHIYYKVDPFIDTFNEIVIITSENDELQIFNCSRADLEQCNKIDEAQKKVFSMGSNSYGYCEENEKAFYCENSYKKKDLVIDQLGKNDIWKKPKFQTYYKN